MFSLLKQNVKLSSFNPRAELHGTETHPAADLTIDANIPNTLLLEFHESLKSLLYMKDAQVDIDEDHMTALRMPKMGTFPYEEEIVGATFTIHHGISAKSDLKMAGCMVNNFKLSAQEGGTVAVKFRVQCHPDEKQMGRLAMMIGTKIEVTIEPPESEDQGDQSPN